MQCFIHDLNTNSSRSAKHCKEFGVLLVPTLADLKNIIKRGGGGLTLSTVAMAILVSGRFLQCFIQDLDTNSSR